MRTTRSRSAVVSTTSDAVAETMSTPVSTLVGVLAHLLDGWRNWPPLFDPQAHRFPDVSRTKEVLPPATTGFHCHSVYDLDDDGRRRVRPSPRAAV